MVTASPVRSWLPVPEGAWLKLLRYGLILLPGTILAWLPVVGLVGMSLSRLSTSDNPHSLARVGGLDLIRRLTEDPAPSLIGHTVLLGLGVALVLWTLASWRPRGWFPEPARRSRWLGALLTSTPPLVIGVAILSLSRVAILGSLWLQSELGWSNAATGLDLLGRILDPYGASGLALCLGVCLANLPSKLRAQRRPTDGDDPEARRVDQAIVAGAGPRRARRVGLSGPGGIPARSIVLWSVVGAMGITPAILLAPTTDCQPIGPGIVVLAAGLGDARSQGAALALATILVEIAAWVGLSTRSVADAGRLRWSSPLAEELV
jgi:hypothetical protein